jgi:glycosyltransferase involved in cell wall biosynthesis
MSLKISYPRIGYFPYSASLSAPGDRRRFVAYARARGLPFEIAHPEEQYDVVVLSGLSDLTVWPDYRYGKVVFDLINSYLAVPRSDFKQMFRGLFKYMNGAHRRLRVDYKGAIASMCRRADAVVCTTEEQKQQIAAYCHNVHIVLDAHSSEIRATKQDYKTGGVFRIAWEGLPINVVQLRQIKDVLRELSSRHRLQLDVVTDLEMPRYFGQLGRVATADVVRRIFSDAVVHPWHEETYAAVICQCDLAVIPIDLGDPFASGKPENKLLLLWRMGMPVVASATPAYRRSMINAGLNLTCASPKNWLTVLEALIGDENLRREAGLRGKAYVDANFSEAQVLAAWDSVFSSIGYDFS